MAEPRWKRAAGARLLWAHEDCLRAWHGLAAALRDLESEERVQNRDGEGRYVLLDAGANGVEQASWSLSASMGHMAAAELLALRGCALVPTDPVASSAHLRHGADAHHVVWLSLIRLQVAREYGQDVLRALEAAYGHLWAAQFMAAHLPQAAGPPAVMEDQVREAIDKIRAVVGTMVNMVSLASFAVEPPARIQ